MGLGLRRRWSLIQALMVALAVVGSGLDMIPSPILAAAGICEPVGEGSNPADAENERDEAPDDDSSDPTWPLVQMAARGEKRQDERIQPAQFPRGWSLESERTPRNQTPSCLARVSLPIRLCRFTC
jgi:hypothetical protein